MLLDRTMFFVRERVGMFKLTDTYDILDPNSQQTVGVAKEEPQSWAKYLRLIVSKQLMPTRVHVYENGSEQPAFSILANWFRSRTTVLDEVGQQVGYFRTKFFSLGGGFRVFSAQDREVAELKGDWKGWNFQFRSANGAEMGTVTKKWGGLAKELFTSADNYIINIDPNASSRENAILLLAASLAIDMIYKEKR